ncbi:MAG: hypothetical protein HY761_10600 [Candidatus Omnitrophica bacterium]|nr:hypothetical protein [Candidatus Omnitrophota bacterium]
MKGRDYFILGSKLFGIWCLFQGIAGLIATASTFVSAPDLDPELHKIYMVTTVVTRLIPILFIASGIYLLRGGNHLYKFAYPDDLEEGPELEEKFTIFVKMLGIYLLVSYIPDLLKAISSFVAYTHAPQYFNMFREQGFTYVHAASSIGGVLTGLYCLKSGKLFIRWAMQSLKTTDSIDE